MSAILVATQRSAAYLLSDAASYDPVTAVATSVTCSKAVAIPTLPAAIACVGPVENCAMFAEDLATEFATFDDLVAQAEDRIPWLFERLSEIWRGGDAAAGLYMIGWLQKEDRPAAYYMNLFTDGSSRFAEMIPNARGAMTDRYKMQEQELSGTPLPPMAALTAAGFRIPSSNEDLIPEVDLLHVMEVARHQQDRGHYWIGGKAVLTVVERDPNFEQDIFTNAERLKVAAGATELHATRFRIAACEVIAKAMRRARAKERFKVVDNSSGDTKRTDEP